METGTSCYHPMENYTTFDYLIRLIFIKQMQSFLKYITYNTENMNNSSQYYFQPTY
jgi:hypothetical protein